MTDRNGAVNPKAQQLFWLPLAPAPESDSARCERIEAYNREAEKVFAGEEVYMVPFVYDNPEQVLRDYLRGNAQKSFSGDEIKALAGSLAQAVRSFGAM